MYNHRMQCYVYKSSKKNDYFLYLPKELDAHKRSETIPDSLLEMLGELALVVDFDLEETRQLPNVDAKQVLAALSDRGFYIQVPKDTMYDDEEFYFN